MHRLWPLSLLVGFLGAWACTQSAGQDCPPGSEGCPCTSGGECDGALSCHSDLCVDADGSTGGDDDDGSATGQNTSLTTTAGTTMTTASTTMSTDAGDSADADSANDSIGDDGTTAGVTSDDPSTSMTAAAESSSSESSSGGGEVVFDGAFLHNVDASGECDEWNDFRADLAGKTFIRITMSGSEDPAGRTCEGPAADSICQAVFSGSPTSVACDGEVWSITDDCHGGLELDVDGYICDCGYHYTVRPCSFTNFWGGLNTDSCDTTSQTISVVCEYE
jgi:hypothetical protein